MDGRALLRSSFMLLLASLAAGCSNTRDFLRLDPPVPVVDWGKSYPEATDNTSPDRVTAAAGTAYPPGNATPAGGFGGPLPNQQPPTNPPPATSPQTAPGYPLPNPAALPNQPAGSQAPPGSATQLTNGCNNCAPGCSPPGGLGQHGANGIPPGFVYSPPPGDVHLRATPTAVGGRLELAPWEIPAERVVELTKQIDTLNALNQTLMYRIRELEAISKTREQSLTEAVRDVEKSDEDLARLRSALQLTREDASLLRARILAIEKEDVDTYRQMISALERLLNVVPSPPRSPP